MPVGQTDMPAILREFLEYHEAIQLHSKKTVSEYYLDMRTFFRFLKMHRGMVAPDILFEDIPICDVTLELIKTIKTADIYAYLGFLRRDKPVIYGREVDHYGVSPSSQARKQACLRSFFDWLTVRREFTEYNPMLTIDMPKLPERLPKYLTLSESRRLLEAVSGPNAARDYCILMLLLNCGMRVSELVGIDLGDIRDDQTIRILGKGNKERTVYLNSGCLEAIESFLPTRDSSGVAANDRNALFLSRNHRRISVSMVEHMVKTTLIKANLNPELYSPHKLRHTAATLMLQNGVDVRVLQEVLGHDNLSTTQIYTHVDSTSLREAAKANPLGGVQSSREKK